MFSVGFMYLPILFMYPPTESAVNSPPSFSHVSLLVEVGSSPSFSHVPCCSPKTMSASSSGIPPAFLQSFSSFLFAQPSSHVPPAPGSPPFIALSMTLSQSSFVLASSPYWYSVVSGLYPNTTLAPSCPSGPVHFLKYLQHGLHSPVQVSSLSFLSKVPSSYKQYPMSGQDCSPKFAQPYAIPSGPALSASGSKYSNPQG